ncbi:OsmC family protein [Neobacillus mesonae]|uniref:OsmC family protein n=1 Tax=Neobacillus mesonae TaxID=1193713 RepID=UPI00203C406A|nr:OsmC family protein [Neobacillus mesonae]MCM3570283.1 OsmC family protein [Neobacillus mesonae]
MAELEFPLNAKWSGTGKEGEGEIIIGEQTLTFSAPENMGGKGVGLSPEDFLIAGVTTCYSGTLFAVLKKAKLPVKEVSIHSKGIVTDYPLKSKFNGLIVSPTIIGGEESRLDEYKKAAEKARQRCFIGKTITGNVDYRVGEVSVK